MCKSQASDGQALLHTQLARTCSSKSLVLLLTRGTYGRVPLITWPKPTCSVAHKTSLATVHGLTPSAVTSHIWSTLT